MEYTNKISMHLQENLAYIDGKITKCSDIIKKKIILKDNTQGYLIYVDGLINIDVLQRDFLPLIMTKEQRDFIEPSNIEHLAIANINTIDNLDTAIENFMHGRIALILDGINYILSVDITQFDKRAIDEPEVEKNIRGPHDGFIEILNTNLAILRRRIQNTNLKFERLQIGTVTKQYVVLAYIEGIVNPTLIAKAYDKVSKVKFDGLIGMGVLSQLITDSKFSPFPMYLVTERPDRVIGNLLEGRIAIMLDGTPAALIAPVSFFSFFQAGDDYISNWMFTSFERALRFLGGLFALFLPALYIAATSYQYYIVPFNLLIPLAESRVKVPFPPIIEALIMELTLEMLREASVRLPTYVGNSIGVVGGIVIGQAAVQARIVSTIFVIVVAVTAISAYVIPNHEMRLALHLLRFPIMIMAALLGLLGVVICSSTMYAYLITLHSLGEPFLTPIAPFKLQDLKDTFIRGPINLLMKRPVSSINMQNDRRKKND